MTADAPPGPSRAHRTLPAAACLLSLLVYLSTGGPVPGNDARAASFLPSALLEHGALSFDALAYPFMFSWAVSRPDGSAQPVAPIDHAALQHASRAGRLHFQGPKYYLVEAIEGRGFINTFGALPGLMATPAAAVAAVVAPGASAAVRHGLSGWVTACLLCALSVGWLLRAALRFAGPAPALLATAAYALGTCTFAVSSQSLWQHAACTFWLTVAADGLILLSLERRGALRCATGLALAVCARPTALMAALVCTAWVAHRHRSQLLRFCLGAAPWAVALLAYHQYYLGSPFASGQLIASEKMISVTHDAETLWATPLWLGAAALLLSPARGLLTHSPVLAFAVPGLRRKGQDFVWPLVAATLAMWIPAFMWFDYWGGWTFGYRPLVDTTPFLALLMAAGLGPVLTRPGWRILYGVALAWSVAVQLVGAYLYDPVSWNDLDDRNVGAVEHRHRLWSVADTQVLYFLRDPGAARDRRLRLTWDWVRDPRR